MNCPFCKNEVEDDSFYCDQCGKEVLLCEKCGQPGKAVYCIDDRGKMLPARLKVNSPLHPPSVPLVMRLANYALKIDISVSNGAVIGRTQGEFSKVFAQFSKISSRHLQCVYDQNKGWLVIDLDSTNGTKISFPPASEWSQIPLLPANSPTEVKHGMKILIANVEFWIFIEEKNSLRQQSSMTPLGTERL